MRLFTSTDQTTVHFNKTYSISLYSQAAFNSFCVLAYALLVCRYAFVNRMKAQRVSTNLQAGLMVIPLIVMIACSMIEFYCTKKITFLIQAVVDFCGYTFIFAYWFWEIESTSFGNDYLVMLNAFVFLVFSGLIVVKNLSHEAQTEYAGNETGYVYSIAESILVFEYLRLCFERIEHVYNKSSEKTRMKHFITQLLITHKPQTPNPFLDEAAEEEKEEKGCRSPLLPNNTSAAAAAATTTTPAYMTKMAAAPSTAIEDVPKIETGDGTQTSAQFAETGTPTGYDQPINRTEAAKKKLIFLRREFALIMVFLISELVSFTIRSAQKINASAGSYSNAYKVSIYIQIAINGLCLIFYVLALSDYFFSANRHEVLIQKIKAGSKVQACVMTAGFIAVTIAALVVFFEDDDHSSPKVAQAFVDIFGYPFLFIYWFFNFTGDDRASCQLQEPYLYCACGFTSLFLLWLGIANIVHGSQTSYRESKTEYLYLQFEFVMLFEFLHLVIERMLSFRQKCYGRGGGVAVTHH